MQHFKDPQLRGRWFFYGPYCIKSLESSLLQLTLSVAMGLLLSLSTVETNSSFVSTLPYRLIAYVAMSFIYYALRTRPKTGCGFVVSPEHCHSAALSSAASDFAAQTSKNYSEPWSVVDDIWKSKHIFKHLNEYCKLSSSLYLSISLYLNLSLSLRDRDRADTIITLYHTTTTPQKTF